MIPPLATGQCIRYTQSLSHVWADLVNNKGVWMEGMKVVGFMTWQQWYTQCDASKATMGSIYEFMYVCVIALD